MSTVVCGPRKSPRQNKQQVKNPQDLSFPPPPPLTKFDKKTCININNLPEYERLKILNVMQNNEVYKAMKLHTLAIGVRNEFRKYKGKEKMQQESEEYIPPEHEEQSENETVKTPKKKNVRNGSASGSGTAKGKAVAENDLPDIENEVVDEGT
ncbi:hypothetical protein POM88_002003 [Heracleum sosnowskyi]|uniref:Uncharacterized protein n=1 Tax=Heracleum sosnowskyi TaxID=360622 RepID=A0AAD8JEP8_9APIA|nr:hypothetical protein POM88_002003 [Heracleum sosnowskyi]